MGIGIRIRDHERDGIPVADYACISEPIPIPVPIPVTLYISIPVGVGEFVPCRLRFPRRVGRRLRVGRRVAVGAASKKRQRPAPAYFDFCRANRSSALAPVGAGASRQPGF